jgi:hypothetical protein
MQVIVAIPCSPEQYAEQEIHRSVHPPSRCPSCAQPGQLKALGYYSRGVTNSVGVILAIWVRRFLCLRCGITVSCLPDFAQPYRLVSNSTIERFFNDQTDPLDVQRNHDRLLRYWRRFRQWAPDLRQLIGSAFGRAPPGEKAGALWQRLMGACKSFTACTRQLIEKFRLTCFGIYLCHRPRPAR